LPFFKGLALKRLQDNKNNEYEKTQKQINEILRALNKHQTGTENTINREISQLRMKIYNIKQEVTHNMENLRKKNETEIQNKIEDHSSRQDKQKTESQNLKKKWQLKEEMANKGKTEELIVNSRPVKRICKNLLIPSKDQP
jgi:hypothetical protein